MSDEKSIPQLRKVDAGVVVVDMHLCCNKCGEKFKRGEALYLVTPTHAGIIIVHQYHFETDEQAKEEVLLMYSLAQL